MNETRTFTMPELEEFLKAGGECGPHRYLYTPRCYYCSNYRYPYRFNRGRLTTDWRYADGKTKRVIIKHPNVLRVNLHDLYPKRIHL